MTAAVLLRLRLLVILVRPAAALILVLYAALGASRSGVADAQDVMVRVIAATLGFLIFAVALNDLADEAIDRVNLPGDRRRPLAAGLAGRGDMVVAAMTGGLVALGAGASLGPAVLAVQGVGLAVAAGYSLRPLRLAGRGAATALVLPVAYVAVPYLTGLLAGRPRPTGGDLWLLAGCSLGFLGRILLKDFRDVRGDALFGKRTFLVRHGRRPTCAISALGWLAGTAVMAAVGPRSWVLVVGESVAAVAAASLLRRLASGREVDGVPSEPRRDEAIISTLSVLGRSAVAAVVLADALTGGLRSAALVGWSALVAAQAVRMYRRGPTTRVRVPVDGEGSLADPAPVAGNLVLRCRPGAGNRCISHDLLPLVPEDLPDQIPYHQHRELPPAFEFQGNRDYGSRHMTGWGA